MKNRDNFGTKARIDLQTSFAFVSEALDYKFVSVLTFKCHTRHKIGALIFRFKTYRLRTFRIKRPSVYKKLGGTSLTELFNEAFLTAARA